MIETILLNNKGFSWSTSDNVSVKGYLFDLSGNYYENEALVKYFDGVESIAEFKQKITQANGVFTVIIRFNQITCIACDKTRFFPLYYIQKSKHYCFSDSPLELLDKCPEAKLNDTQAEIFKTAGFTLGRETLIQGINEVQAAEYLIFRNHQLLESGRFFSYAVERVSDASYQELKDKGEQIIDKVFQRLIVSLKGRQVALPLSGGYDSRLIAVMLKKYGYQNVVCFTYGKKNNFELENSKSTAQKLGFKWVFVEYDRNIIEGYLDTDTFKEYALFAGKISSMPYMQEFFAVKYLKNNQIINDDAVFIPGHSGDLLGGSQFVKAFNHGILKENLENQFFRKKFRFTQVTKNTRKQVCLKVHHCFAEYADSEKPLLPYSVFEDVDIKEKIAKLIINSSAVFVYYNYQVRFPYWDDELMDYFKFIPAKFKISKQLYNDILKNCYFAQYDVNFESELQPSHFFIKLQQFKDLLKGFLPYKLNLRLLIKNDWINYYEITKPMGKDIKFGDKKISNFNAVIAAWYVSLMQKSMFSKTNNKSYH
jgi:asparagine synthase (glutamine-hydrolysing)